MKIDIKIEDVISKPPLYKYAFFQHVFFNVDNIFQIFLKNDFLTVQCI